MATRHYERERDLQGRIEAVLEAAVPEVEVVDVVLDDPQEKVTVFIDREGGVALEHCEGVTHAIRETCPDHELEVSSPGIERPLRRAAHFRDAIGERVRLRQQGRHRASVLEIVAVDDQDGVTLRPPGGSPDEQRVVPFAEIVRAKLVVEDPFAALNRKGNA